MEEEGRGGGRGREGVRRQGRHSYHETLVNTFTPLASTVCGIKCCYLRVHSSPLRCSYSHKEIHTCVYARIHTHIQTSKHARVHAHTRARARKYKNKAKHPRIYIRPTLSSLYFFYQTFMRGCLA